MSIETTILIAGALLLAAVLSGKLASKIGVPSLLLFLALGMLAGSEGLGGIAFDSAEQAQTVGTVALLVILFAGGLDTRWRAIRPVLAPGLVLATVGVVVTTALLGVFAKFMLESFSTFGIGRTGISWMGAMLLAAIVSSTDAAAVFSVYRTAPVQPRTGLRSLLELESGSNDPMAVLLTTTLIGLMTTGGGSPLALIGTLAGQFLLGGLIGFGAGWLGAKLVNAVRLPTTGLYPIAVLAMGMVGFGLSHLAGGNSFLAVYVAGVVIGNSIETGRDEVMAFHDGLSWLAQIAMFIVLGLLVFPSRLLPVAGVSIALAFFLMLVARPVAVAVSLLPFGTRPREIGYVSWVGLRGSVPIVLATFPASAGLAGADGLFHVIYFIVVVSVLVQGSTLVSVTRRMGVADK